MVLPTPYVIDARARHDADVLRAVADLASEGQEGVRGPTHLAVKALATPAGAITVAPGVYSVRNTAVGASFENYIGKVRENELVEVSPTDSSGPRTDLVILIIQNPYVAGTGQWPEPSSPEQGPYAFIRVRENVNPNTQTVKAIDPAWTAITLARITRPANTGIVTQAHITDLRSMIDLTIERIVIVNNPPPDPPPIAQQVWTESTPIGNNNQLPKTQTAWTNFPDQASWKVPVPSWALGMDVLGLLNPTVKDDVYGEFRLLVDGQPTNAVPVEFNVNFPSGIGDIREMFMVGGTVLLPASVRGREVNMRFQARMTGNPHPGRVVCEPGARVFFQLNFKRFTVVSDGG